MDTVLVRFSEIATKSHPVRGKMLEVLRQRVRDRIVYEDFEFDGVHKAQGRIIIDTPEAEKAAEAVSELPGAASASPTIRADAELDSIKEAVRELDIGETFGVDTNRAGEHDFNSKDVNIEIGSYIEDLTGANVDLDDPETWVEIDIRFEEAFIFSKRFEGPDGFPVGTAGRYAALISGGIDSPVAAYEIMTRGADVTPIYFYNKPIAAEDHLLRFRSAVSKLERFHPAKKWEAFVVDMEEVNQELMRIGRGRMLLHRQLMFAVSSRIAEDEGLNGLVTGESMSQKSSQTSSNLEMTTSSIDKPVLRPLLTWSKRDIVEEAKMIGSFEDANIASACRTMAPDSPATSMKDEKMEELKEKVGFDELVEKACDSIEKIEI
ncbi:MAG: tRNA sulfurtransferase [Candidatus Nanohaloarchaea archaeon]